MTQNERLRNALAEIDKLCNPFIYIPNKDEAIRKIACEALSAPPEDVWISVEDQPLPKGSKFIMHYSSGSWFTAAWYKGKFRYDDGETVSRDILSGVTHWMIPPPPSSITKD